MITYCYYYKFCFMKLQFCYEKGISVLKSEMSQNQNLKNQIRKFCHEIYKLNFWDEANFCLKIAAFGEITLSVAKTLGFFVTN